MNTHLSIDEPASEQANVSFLASTSGRTFLAVVLAHFFADLCGSIWPIFKKIAELDLSTAGWIATGTGVVGMALQPVFGFWAEKAGRRLFLILGVALAGLGFSFGPIWLMRKVIGEGAMYWTLLGVMMLLTLGLAMFHPAGASIAGSINTARRSTAIAVFVAAGSLGFACGQYLFASVFTGLSGHSEVMLIPYGLLVLMLILWCRPRQTHEAEHHSLHQTWAALVGAGRPLILLYLILASVAGLAVGLIFLLPEYIELKGYPDWFANGGAFFFIILGGSVTMIPVCHYADQHGRKKFLVIYLFGSVVCYYGLLLLPQMPVAGFAAFCFLTGAFVSTCNPLGVSLGQHLMPNHTSITSGILMGLAWALGNFAPSIVANMAEQPGLGIEKSLLIWGVVIVFAAVLSLFLPSDK